jgi:predicted metal-binding membrane protein
MNIEQLLPIAAWAVLVLALATPTAYRLIKNYHRIRQHKKNLPGPLLGVVYPKTKDKN